MQEEVNLVVEALINYKNPKKLSWIKSYEDVLQSLNLGDRTNDNDLLNGVIKELSRQFYYIEDKPFHLIQEF